MSYDSNEARDDHGRWSASYGNSSLSLSSPVAVSDLARRSLKSSLTPHEEEAITKYTSEASGFLNYVLRKNKPVDDYQEVLRGLDSSFQKASLAENVSAFRVVNQAAANKIDKLKSSFTDKGYISTTYSATSANQIKDWREEDVNEATGRLLGPHKIFQVLIPKGYPALVIPDESSIYAADKEILLKRGSKFQIVRPGIIKAV